MRAVEIRMNATMRAIYGSDNDGPSRPPLSDDLDAVARAGFVLSDDRLYLAQPEHDTPPPPGMDAWEAERWVNKIHLDTDASPTEATWRAELLGGRSEERRVGKECRSR